MFLPELSGCVYSIIGFYVVSKVVPLKVVIKILTTILISSFRVKEHTYGRIHLKPMVSTFHSIHFFIRIKNY